jgi:diguanylate cyclase (GGDEF)-like protein
MCADFRFATIGSSVTVAKELLTAAQELFSSSFAFAGNFTGEAYAIADLIDDKVADLFLCQPTRVEEAVTKISREKIVVLELIPPAEFYVKLSKVPHEAIVYVFNNNRIQAEKMAFYCKKNGVDHVMFFPIAYAELSKKAVAARLARAKYIAGNEQIVGECGILQMQYQQHLRSDVEIFGANRVATVQSACAVMHWVALFTYKKILTEVAAVSAYVSNQFHEMVEITGTISKSIGMTVATIANVEASLKDEHVIKMKPKTRANELTCVANGIDGIETSLGNILRPKERLILNETVETVPVHEPELGVAAVSQEVRKLAEESRLTTASIRRSVKTVQDNYLELKKYRDVLEKMSRIDGLTGLANRRYFDEIFHREWRRVLRNKSSLTVLLLDIDFFKKYNDSYGHLAGDDCLRQVGSVLKNSLRHAGEFVARYGGEEFVAILPFVSSEEALQVAEKLRGNIESLKITHQMSDVCEYVTVSIGVAAVRIDKDHVPARLVDKADNALYQAKREGRNRVVVAGG